MPAPGLLRTAILSRAQPAVSDSDAQRFVDVAYLRGSRMSQAWADAYNSLVAGLKADGVWNLTEWLWIWGGPDAFAGVVDIRRLVEAVPVAAPTFAAKSGYALNGTTQYIDTTRIPSTHFSVATEDSVAIGVWCVTDVAATQIDLGAGGAGSPGELQIISLLSANTQRGRSCSSAAQDFAAMPVSSSIGLTMQSRTADNVTTGYKDGIAHGAVSTTASTGLPIVSLYVGAKNQAGTPATPSTRTQYASGVWAGLDATQALAVYTRLNAFKTITAGL